jgi:NitT/TauT family transport system permease protein
MAIDQALHGLDSLEVGPRTGPPESRASRLARKAWAKSWPKLLAIALVLLVWQLFYLSNFHGDTADHLVIGPGQGLPNLWHQLTHGVLLQAVGTTMQRAVVGFGLSLILGIVIGAFVSRIPPLRAAAGSIITGLQTMPSIAWFPFAIILFGTNNSAILFVVVLGSAPSIANGMIAGVDYTPPLLLRAGKVMGLHGPALYRHLILPASLPAFVAGMKQGWAFAWRSLMAGELVVPIAGASLGVLLNSDQQSLDLNSAISVMIVILIIGIVVDGLFAKADLAIRNRRGLLDAALSV